MKSTITIASAVPLWLFTALSPHIEVEERVFTEERLNILNNMVRWAHVRHIKMKNLRGKDRLKAAGISAAQWDKFRDIRVSDPMLVVSIEPINRVEA